MSNMSSCATNEIMETLEQREQELALLKRVNQVLNSSLDLDRVLAAALEETRRLLNAAACSVWLNDSQSGELVCQQASGPQHEMVENWRISPDEGIVGWVFRTGESTFIPDVQEDDRHYGLVDAETGLTSRAIISVPLQAKGGIIGVLQAVDTVVGRFTAHHLDLLEILAASAASAIENARLYENAEQIRRFNEQILRAMSDGILVYDEEGLVTFANAKSIALLGYALDDLIGQPWHAFLEPVDAPAPGEGKGPFNFPGQIACRHEAMLMDRNGQHVPVIISTQPLIEEKSFVGGIVTLTDISERVQMERDLRKSEQRYRVISELTSDFAYGVRVDPQENFTLDWIAGAFTCITGYSEDELKRLNVFLDVVHPDDLSALRDHLQVCLSGDSFGIEHRIFTKTGEIRWLKSYSYPVWDEVDKRVTYVYWASQDVTERVQAKLAERKVEERYRVVSEMTTDFTWSVRVEPEQTVVLEWITDAFFRMTQYAIDEIKTFDQWREIIHPDDLSVLRQSIEVALSNEKYVANLRIITKGGDIRHVQIHNQPVWNETLERVERVYGAGQNITETVEAERALKASEERYRAVSELTSDFAYSFAIRPDGTFYNKWMTDAFTRITGFTCDELETEEDWLNLIHPEDRRMIQNHLQSLAKKQPAVDELRIVTKDRKILWLLIHTHPIWSDEEDRMLQFNGAAQDISNRKQMQLQAQGAERLAALGQLAAILAHEINNPLQALRSGFRLLTNYSLEEEKRRRYLEIASQEVERLIVIVERMLNFYRPSTEKREMTDVNRLVKEVLLLLDKKLQHQGIVVQSHLQEDLPLARVVPGQIKQVFLNIILNAMDAMTSGGDIIVETGWEAMSGELWIGFTDTGEGMSPDEMSQIFDPLYTSKPKGTGLGLAISQNIVEQYKGRIDVISQKGEGSTFTVLLPVAGANSRHQEGR